MSLKKKLMYYAIGIILGIILVKAIWAKTGYKGTYFPSERIVSNIAKKQKKYSDSFTLQMKKEGVSQEMLEKKFEAQELEASVKNREAKPCKEYFLETSFFQKRYVFEVQNCDSVVHFQKFQIKN